MTANEQLNQLIATLESEIADKEKQLTEISFDIKLKKAKLKQLKKLNEPQNVA